MVSMASRAGLWTQEMTSLVQGVMLWRQKVAVGTQEMAKEEQEVVRA